MDTKENIELDDIINTNTTDAQNDKSKDNVSTNTNVNIVIDTNIINNKINNANVAELDKLDISISSNLTKLFKKADNNNLLSIESQISKHAQTITIDRCLKIISMMNNFYDDKKNNIGRYMTAQNLIVLLIEIKAYLTKIKIVKDAQNTPDADMIYFKELNLIIPIYRKLNMTIYLNLLN
jgi:hypothetical protein